MALGHCSGSADRWSVCLGAAIDLPRAFAAGHTQAHAGFWCQDHVQQKECEQSRVIRAPGHDHGLENFRCVLNEWQDRSPKDGEGRRPERLAIILRTRPTSFRHLAPTRAHLRPLVHVKTYLAQLEAG